MKELRDMSLEELWSLFPILLKEHNSDYSLWYEDEKKSLVRILNAHNISRINHIGSTSVKGLIAKPIIDILLEFSDIYNMNSIAGVLQSSGWIIMARNNAESSLALNKGYTPNGFTEKVFHLHVKPYGDWGELYFRDYLKKYPDVARQYGDLKLQLKKKFKHNRDEYTNEKSDFVIKYTQKARKEFAGLYLPNDTVICGY